MRHRNSNETWNLRLNKKVFSLKGVYNLTSLYLDYTHGLTCLKNKQKTPANWVIFVNYLKTDCCHDISLAECESTFVMNLIFQFSLAYNSLGPAQMTVGSTALPLTASRLSPLPEFGSRPGHVRELLRQRLRVRRCFSPGIPIFSISYNWPVKTSPQYGIKSPSASEGCQVHLFQHLFGSDPFSTII